MFKQHSFKIRESVLIYLQTIQTNSMFVLVQCKGARDAHTSAELLVNSFCSGLSYVKVEAKKKKLYG